MAAVVRLKRHLDDEPLGALILNCKKRKRSTNDSESEISTVLKFAGTLTTQTDDISSHISKLTKEDLKESYKKHVPNVTSKIRQQRKEAAENSRFKVVNFIRAIDHEINSLEYRSSTDEDKQLALTVLDVETEVQANGEKTATDESDYVYDLYYTNSEGIDDTEFDSEFRVCPANEIIFDTYEDGIGMASDHDSDDSNDENNWRNDYPDEDDDDEQDDDTIDEDDMRKAMDCLSLNGDTLSSDDGEEGFSYSIDSEAVGSEEDLDPNDGRRYGELYARFKAKQKKEEEKYNKDLYHDEIDDTDDDFYDQ